MTTKIILIYAGIASVNVLVWGYDPITTTVADILMRLIE